MIFFVLPLLIGASHVVLAAVFFAFWYVDRTAHWGRFWAIFHLCYGPGALLAYAIDNDGTHIPISVMVPYAFLFGIGIACFLAGVLSFTSKSISLPRTVAVGLAIGVALLFLPDAMPMGLHQGTVLVLTCCYAGGAVVVWRLSGMMPRVVAIILLLRVCGNVLYVLLVQHVPAIIGQAPVVNTVAGVAMLIAALVDYSRRTEAVRNELLLANAQLIGLTVNLEQKSTEYAEARDRAEAANRAKSQFLGNMSHELRTPLNAVIGYSELIQLTNQRNVNNPIGDYIDNILAAGRQLLAIVDDVLDLSRVDFGSIKLDRRPVSVAELIDETVRTISVKAQEKGQKIDLEITPDLVVPLDGRLMRQALLNIVGNAVKFTPESGSIRIEAYPSETDRIEIRVTDSGPGIPLDMRERVFDRFWQHADSMTRSHHGVGLGLSIAKRFVELHDGTIRIDTAEASGACFIVNLPCQIMDRTG